MRRWLMGLSLVFLAGCGGLKDLLGGKPTIAAEARGQTLTVDRLSRLMTGIKGVPLTKEAADFIASMWVDQTLLAQALAAGDSLTDSATAALVLWPEIAELRGGRWHDALVARRVPLTDAAADSIYAADQVRVLQHILFRLPPNAEPPARAAARRKADAAYARARGGADFARLAREVSQDPGSSQDGGFLPPSPRGKWVTAFDSAGWSLAPGAMSAIVESPFGFHIIRRPAPGEVRDRLTAFGRERIGAALDSMYLDSLGLSKHLTVDRSAPQAMQEALLDREKASRSTRVLTTFDGGSFTVREFMQWVNALGPSWAADLAQRPDSMLTAFAKLITQNALLLRQADSAGIQVTPLEWAGMLQRYRGQLDTLRIGLELAGGDITDPATPPADRARVAGIKVESYWDRIATGTRPRPLPAPLAAVLRERARYRIDRGGLERAVELAQGLKAATESALSVPAGPAPGVTPGAPSPPPAP